MAARGVGLFDSSDDEEEFLGSLRGIKQELYAKSFQVNDICETYLPTLKTHVVNLKRDAKDLSRDLQWLEVCDKLVSKTLYY